MRISDFRRGSFAPHQSVSQNNNQGNNKAEDFAKMLEDMEQAKIFGMLAADNDLINSVENPDEAENTPVKFAEADATKEEYNAALMGYSAELLKLYDSTYGNKDGIVTVDEHQEAIYQLGISAAQNSKEYDASEINTKAASQASLLYSEAIDLDGNKIISVEELATVNAYADIFEGSDSNKGDANPFGTITPFSRDAVDSFILGLDNGEDSPMARYVMGEDVSDSDMKEISNFLAWERANLSSIAENNLDIDLSDNSSYLNIFNQNNLV